MGDADVDNAAKAAAEAARRGQALEPTARPIDPGARTLRASVQRFVRSFGLLDSARTPCGQPLATSDAHALMALEEHGGAPWTGWLARRLALDKSSATRLVKRLASRDLVEVAADPDDARRRRVALTARGRTLAATLQASSLAHFEAISARSEVPVAELVRTLEALSTAVETLAPSEDQP